MVQEPVHNRYVVVLPWWSRITRIPSHAVRTPDEQRFRRVERIVFHEDRFIGFEGVDRGLEVGQQPARCVVWIPVAQQADLIEEDMKAGIQRFESNRARGIEKEKFLDVEVFGWVCLHRCHLACGFVRENPTGRPNANGIRTFRLAAKDFFNVHCSDASHTTRPGDWLLQKRAGQTVDTESTGGYWGNEGVRSRGT